MTATNTQRWLVRIGIASSAILGAYVLFGGALRFNNPARPKGAAPGAGEELADVDPAADERALDPQSTASNSTFTPPPNPNAATPTAPALWRFTEGNAPVLAGMQNGHVREPQRVHLDREALAALELGSLVPIELPGSRTYLARVEHMAAHDNGDRSWSGHLDGYGLLYPVIYTQGDFATFGTIASPEGLFALEAGAEDGALFRDERAALQDPHQDCAVLPN